MAFNGAFQLNRTANKNVFQLVDTSTGEDENLTGRIVTVYKSDGAVLSGAIPWSIEDASIMLDILNTDMAIDVSVSWNSSSPLPSPSTYTYSQIFAMTAYLEDFYYSLTQGQTSQPNIISDQYYYTNKGKLRVEIDSANQAIEWGEDIQGAQYCIERALYLMANKFYYF